jgi:hypothetical protein
MIYASPTSLDRHGACRRKQAYSRKIKDDRQSLAAAFGDRMHLQGEHWLSDGTPPDVTSAEGECLLAGLPYLPMPGTCLGVELRDNFDHEGIRYTFRIDFVYLASTVDGRALDPAKDEIIPATAALVIGDHKSAGSLSRTHYPKDGSAPRRRTAADLTDDLQRIIYGEWALREYPEFEQIGAHWQYYQTKPPGHTFALFVLEHRDAVHARFLHVHETRTLPLAADHGIPPDELPRNLRACGDYGGCPYRPECHVGVSPAQIALASIRKR